MNRRKILVIDGGGIKGVFPCAFLSEIEKSIQKPVSCYFDLIVGTSTGGIIALALGLGLPASEILQFYKKEGPKIFEGNGWLCKAMSLFRAKYRSDNLRIALQKVFHDRKLGSSSKRLVIPSLNFETGEVYVWKTPHHERFERDYKADVVSVALATSAAPSYLPTHRSADGVPLIDGGVWANNPMLVAAIEAVTVLNWNRTTVDMLSIGCTTPPFSGGLGRWRGLGKAYWCYKAVDTLMTAQSNSAVGMSELLIGRENITRISPQVRNGIFALDGIREIESLSGLGYSEARKQYPLIKRSFFETTVEDDYIPLHPLRNVAKINALG